MSFTSSLINAAFSLIFVIGLILVTAWLFRWWQEKRATLQPRAKTSRLGVVQVLPIDMKRKLILVRRDDVEHLLLCSDGQDIVIETQILGHHAASADQPTDEV